MIAHEGWKDLSPPHQAFKSQPCHGVQFTPDQLSSCIHFALGNRARFLWEEQVSATRKFCHRIFERVKKYLCHTHLCKHLRSQRNIYYYLVAHLIVRALKIWPGWTHLTLGNCTMVVLCLSLVNQIHISSGSSHEWLWSCSKWVSLIHHEPNSSYLNVSNKNCWTCNNHAARSSSEQVLARSNAQRRRHRCCIFTTHGRMSAAVHLIFHCIVSVPISS